jgi:hypothetical protein
VADVAQLKAMQTCAKLIRSTMTGPLQLEPWSKERRAATKKSNPLRSANGTLWRLTSPRSSLRAWMQWIGRRPSSTDPGGVPVRPRHYLGRAAPRPNLAVARRHAAIPANEQFTSVIALGELLLVRCPEAAPTCSSAFRQIADTVSYCLPRTSRTHVRRTPHRVEAPRDAARETRPAYRRDRSDVQSPPRDRQRTPIPACAHPCGRQLARIADVVCALSARPDVTSFSAVFQFRPLRGFLVYLPDRGEGAVPSARPVCISGTCGASPPDSPITTRSTCSRGPSHDLRAHGGQPNGQHGCWSAAEQRSGPSADREPPLKDRDPLA